MLFSFITEYALILKIHLRAIIRKTPPKAWGKGIRGDILLIPGFNETWVFLETIAEYLNKKGYKIHVIARLSLNYKTIRQSVEILNQYIEENKLDNVILLSHSKGGIIAKTFMDTHKNGNTVKKSISIASPYHGSIFGYLWILSLKELTSRTQIIKDLTKETKNNHKIYNLYAKVDNHIIPNKNAILPGAHNQMIEITGHTRILKEQKTIQIIEEILYDTNTDLSSNLLEHRY